MRVRSEAKYFGRLIAVLASLVAAPTQAEPQTPTEKPAAPTRQSLRSHPISQPPTIDGVLDDDAWREGSLETGEWLWTTRCSAHPFRRKRRSGSGTTPTTSTLRSSATTPTRRLSKRPSRAATTSGGRLGGHQPRRAGTGQLSYHLMVNPNGVQLDMLNTVSGGEDQSARLRVGQRRTQERGGLRR